MRPLFRHMDEEMAAQIKPGHQALNSTDNKSMKTLWKIYDM
jgi:hypothetical protein